MGPKFNPYTYARICAMKSLLFRSIDYEKMMKLSLPEIAKYLQDRVYSEEITRLGIEYTGIELIQVALNMHLSRILHKVYTISDKDTRDVLKAYLKKYEIYNLKTLLRGKAINTEYDEIKDMLIPVSTTHEELMKLYGMSKEEIMKMLPEGARELNKLYNIENTLDLSYYDSLLKLKKEIGKNEISYYIDHLVDVYNLKLIFKSVRFNLAKKAIEEFMIMRGGTLDNKLLEKLAASRSAEQVIVLLKDTRYSELLNLETAASNEIILDTYLLNKSQKLFHKKPMSSNVALSYVFSKEIEVQNIMIIAKSKILNVDKKLVEKVIL